MPKPEHLPYDSHPFAYGRSRRRSPSGRAMRKLVLPLSAAVLFAMVAIPLLSIGLVGDADIRFGPRTTAHGEVRLVDLPDLPHRTDLRRESEIRDLKEWLRAHFSEEEIDEMRERFVGDRDPDQVRAEIHELSEEVAQGVFLDIPRDFADRLKERLGEDRMSDLRGHFTRIGPSSGELRTLALEEVFPGKH